MKIATRGLMGLVLITLILGSNGLIAQELSGSIRGVVKDETGGVLPGAIITIVNPDKNSRVEVQTNETGSYLVPNLSPGGYYQVTVDVPGFEAQIKPNLSVSLGQTTIVDFTLKVGSVSFAVVVTEKTPVLETTKGEISFLLDKHTVENLPLGRNVHDAVFLTPGIAPTGSDSFANGSGFSSNGQRGRSNNFVLDGQNNNDPTVTGPLLSLRNPEIIEEVQVVTSSYKAEYGRNMGSVVNVVTRGGTNQFHADANYFYVGSTFSSLNNLEKNAGFTKKPWFLQHQYGLTVDGPIKKDKLFFLGYFQREQFKGLTVSPTYIAPTAAGQQTLLALRQQGLVSPDTTDLLLKTLAPANGAVLGFLPIGLGRPAIELGELTGTTPQQVKINNYGGRLDFPKDNRNSFFGRLFVQNSASPRNGSVIPQGSGYAVSSGSHTGGVAWDRLISTHAFNRLHFLIGKFDANFNAEKDHPFSNLPEIIMFTGFSSPIFFGVPSSFPQGRQINTYQIQDQLSWIKGRHSFKTGVDLNIQRTTQTYLPLQRGRLLYLPAGGFTGFSNFIDNYASFGTQWFGPDTYRPNLVEQAYFLQDDWRLHPNLTVNYGLRYEHGGQPNNILAELSQGTIPRLDTDTNNFAPRFGFAWVPQFWFFKDRKTVVRGGAGLSYDPGGGFLNITLNAIHTPPIVLNGTFNVRANLRGFPTAYPTVLPLLKRLAETSDPASQFQTKIEPGFRAPKAEHFNLSIQRELPGTNVLGVTYVGARGLGLYQSLDGNPFLPETGVRLFPGQGQRRIRSNAAASTYHGLQAQWQKRFQSRFTATVSYAFSKSIDDASEIFDAASSAFAQDPFNRHLDRAPSAFDRTHVMTIYYIYQPPAISWNLKTWRLGWGLNQLTKNWQLSGITQLVSGQPFTVKNGFDANSDQPPFSSANDRPDIGNPQADYQSVALATALVGGASSTGYVDANYQPIDPAQAHFVQMLNGIGNSPRSYLRADGLTNFNFAVFRNWPVRRFTVQFQSQFFNIFNTRDYFGIPDATVGSQTFLNYGQTTFGNSRDMLFGLKVLF